MTNILEYIKNIHNKPEKTRVRIMWALVIFFSFAAAMVWGINFFYSQPQKLKINETKQSFWPTFRQSMENINQAGDKLTEKISGDIEKEKIDEISRNYLKSNNFLEEDDAADLEIKEIKKQNGKWFIEYQQRYRGIPVQDNVISLVIEENSKNVTSYSSSFDPYIAIETTPKITMETAYDTLIKKTGIEKPILKKSELIISKDINGKSSYILNWKFNVFSKKSLRDFHYLVNTENKDIIPINEN